TCALPISCRPHSLVERPLGPVGAWCRAARDCASRAGAGGGGGGPPARRRRWRGEAEGRTDWWWTRLCAASGRRALVVAVAACRARAAAQGAGTALVRDPRLHPAGTRRHQALQSPRAGVGTF